MITLSHLKGAARHAALVVAALLPLWASAQTLTLSVPYRGATSMQTASTTIEFDASAIAAGATINVAGIPMPVAGAACVGLLCNSINATAAGDDILVRRVSGTNRAQLELSYTSTFNAVTHSLCDYKGPTDAANPRQYSLILTGFTFGVGTNGFRITSFMAPSDISCDKAYLRVAGGARPTLSGGGLIKRGRLPLNIVLVLDKSPSMNWTIPSSADIRWNRLKTSAQLFASVWDSIGAPPFPGTVSSEGHPDDRLGLVFFGGTAVESPLDGASFFKQRGVSAAPWGAAVSAALVDTFIGGTSIGAGITNARSRLNGVGLLTGDTAIVLFTDGEQNTPPCITHTGETLSPTFKAYPGEPPGTTYLDQCTVAASAGATASLRLNGSVLASDVLPIGPIFTIGLGQGGVADAAKLLNEISDETAGRARFPNDGLAMDTSFLDQLVDNLKGSTVSLLERVTTEVPAGASAGGPMQVRADPSLTRMTFVLSWDQAGSSREVRLLLRDPNGVAVNAPITSSGANSRVATVNLPSDGPAGTWQAIVERFSNPSVAMRYQLSAMGVESRLSSRVYESARKGTDGPLKIVAEVGWDDAALVDLPPGAIRAIIERPNENLGNAFHDNTQRDSNRVRDDTSPLAMKFDRLVRDSNLLARIEPRELAQSVPLTHVGNGRYEGSFDSMIVGGKYRVRVVYDWNDPRTGAIHRLETAERQVQVAPTARDSLVQLQRAELNGTVMIRVTPRDRFGNYVGPGFENRFTATTSVGTLSLPFSDPDVTGTYGIRLTGLPPGADPNVQITFAGQTIRDTTLSGIESGGGSGGKYAIWLALGGTVPHGSFGNAYKRGFAATLGFEYMFKPSYSVEATLSGYRFGGKSGVADLDVTQIGVNAKWYLTPAPLRWFATAGVGSYAFSPGSTHMGVNAGAGLQYTLTPSLSLEARYGLHSVSGNAPSARFSTLQAGLRYKF